MKLINFKLVTVICEPVLSPRILELSHELGATGFTMTDVKGQGSGEKSSGEIPDSKLKIEIVQGNKKMGTKLFYLIILYIVHSPSTLTYKHSSTTNNDDSRKGRKKENIHPLIFYCLPFDAHT